MSFCLKHTHRKNTEEMLFILSLCDDVCSRREWVIRDDSPVLGHGSSGMVYKTTLLGISVAVKVAKPDRSNEEGTAVDYASESLRHEFEVYRSLSWRCRSIPALITYGSLLTPSRDGTGVGMVPFLATAVVPGRPILQIAKATGLHGSLTAAAASSWARSASLASFAALREIHDAGFAHNDIANPNNVGCIDNALSGLPHDLRVPVHNLQMCQLRFSCQQPGIEYGW